MSGARKSIDQGGDEVKYRVDIGKAFVAGTTGGVFLVIGAVAWAAGYDWLSAAAFAFTAIYVWLAVRNAAVLYCDKTGIHTRMCGQKLRSCSWDDIKEFGVMGTRVFGSEKRRNKGRRYVYFSKNRMDDSEHFKMCLNWPPKNCPYALYTDGLIKEAQKRPDIEPVYYNTEEP